MGNYASDNRKRSQAENAVCEFRVYIHRRNKFIHAWLKVSPSEIIVERSKSDVLVFPLQYLRRYGYTSAGVFFFESGRRCASGEGLHTYQSQHAENIFHLVQSRIQDTANSTQAEWTIGQNSIQGRRAESADQTPRIHPIQRYSSEGNTGTNVVVDFSQSAYNSQYKGEYRRRPSVQLTPQRPHSLSGLDDHRLIDVRTSHGHAHIIGNIISENMGPASAQKNHIVRATSQDDQKTNSYANVCYSPSGNNNVDFPYRPRCPSACSVQSTISTQSVQSMPTTPTKKVFPMQWDGGAGSTSFLCYANTMSAPVQDVDCGRYVNLREIRLPSATIPRKVSKGMLTNVIGVPIDQRPSPASVSPAPQYASLSAGTLPRAHRQLNYAAIGAPLAVVERSSRSPSVGGSRSDSCIQSSANQVNYSLIDANKTMAIQQARDEHLASKAQADGRKYSLRNFPP